MTGRDGIMNIILLSMSIILSCQQRKQDTILHAELNSNLTSDTLIGSQNITDQIPGSSYRKKATAFFLIIGNDTSDFKPVFMEYKDGSVGLNLDISYLHNNVTYEQRLNELKLILKKAAAEYNFDFLQGITLGRLILMGDLAVKVTNQYEHTFGFSSQIQVNTKDYEKVSNFLLDSQLGTDFDSLFKPYSVFIEKMDIEKVFFTTKRELYQFSVLELDSTQAPEKILDCLVGMSLKKY